MTLDEADRIIAELNVVFPTKKLSVEEVVRWEENLLPFSLTSARQAIKAIEQTMSFWPSWADFLNTVRPIHQREVLAQQTLAIEAPYEPPSKEFMAQIRAMFPGNGRGKKE